MDDRQVRDEAMTLFLAGHETTAAALAWAMYLLAKHPEVRARMEDELDRTLGDRPVTYEDLRALPYTLQVLKETMRLYPPAYFLGRRASGDVTIGGHRLRKNQVVLLNVAGIHRNPRVWADPERFDPDRFSPDGEKALVRKAYLPFGAGPRICIGNQFALMEGHLLLATWCRRIRAELADGTADVSEEPLITLRPKGGLAMRLEARSPGASPAVAPIACSSGTRAAL
jgi:cytochrome P450